MNARDQEFAELLDKIGHNVVHISSINEREWVPHFWCRNCNIVFFLYATSDIPFCCTKVYRTYEEAKGVTSNGYFKCIGDKITDTPTCNDVIIEQIIK